MRLLLSSKIIRSRYHRNLVRSGLLLLTAGALLIARGTLYSGPSIGTVAGREPSAAPPPTPVPVVVTRRTPQVERLKLLTRLLDNAFQIPGTQFRIGLDAIVGIIPGIGDAIGAVFSTFIVFQAARLGVSRATLARMMGNAVLDTIIGAIPLLGDLFDAGWKANTKNMALLEAHLDRPAATGRSSRKMLVLLGAGLLVLLAGVIALGVLVAKLVVVQMR